MIKRRARGWGKGSYIKISVYTFTYFVGVLVNRKYGFVNSNYVFLTTTGNNFYRSSHDAVFVHSVDVGKIEKCKK
jgi:hypothetical protein